MDQNSADLDEAISQVNMRIRGLESLSEDHPSRHLSNVAQDLVSAPIDLARLSNSRRPMTSLPDDVLIAIAEENPRSIRHLSCVCHRLREVIVNTPPFWTVIRITPSYPKDMIDTYLERSQCCRIRIILEVDIYCGCISPPAKSPTLPRSLVRMMKKAIAHSSRWYRFDLSGYSYKRMCAALAMLKPLYAPSLKKVNVFRWAGADMGGDDAFGPLFIQGAPLLSSLEFSGFSMDIYQIPLSAVTDLTLDLSPVSWVSFSRVINTLGSTPLLRTLSLTANFTYYPEDHYPSITLPSLVSLAINVMHDEEVLTIFMKTVSMPSLLSLSAIAPWIPSSYDLMEPVEEGLHFPHLNGLHIVYIEIPGPIEPSFFHSLPAIRHLILDVEDGDPLLCALQDNATSHSHGHLWPQLCTIGVSHTDPNLLYDVITQRIAAGLPLIKLSLGEELLRDFPAEKLSWLRERLEVDILDTESFNPHYLVQ